MRTLIITTGSSKIILTRWLPLLRTVGKCDADVMVMDYGIIVSTRGMEKSNPLIVRKLRQELGVTVLQPIVKMRNIFIDRMNVARSYLLENNRYKKYDVIMIIDGNDTIFWGPIQPLLDMAKEKLCYVKEHFSNLLKIWDDFFPRDFIQKEYKSIENSPIINGGMIVGPTQAILDVLNGEMDLVTMYGDGPSDQLFFDLLIYYFKYPSREVGYEWNYTHAVIGKNSKGEHYGPRMANFVEGKAYAVEDGRPIIIEHRTGTGWWFWQSKEGLELLANDVPVSIMEEFKHCLNYKSLHFDAARGVDPVWFLKFKYPAF